MSQIHTMEFSTSHARRRFTGRNQHICRFVRRLRMGTVLALHPFRLALSGFASFLASDPAALAGHVHCRSVKRFKTATFRLRNFRHHGRVGQVRRPHGFDGLAYFVVFAPYDPKDPSLVVCLVQDDTGALSVLARFGGTCPPYP